MVTPKLALYFQTDLLLYLCALFKVPNLPLLAFHYNTVHFGQLCVSNLVSSLRRAIYYYSITYTEKDLTILVWRNHCLQRTQTSNLWNTLGVNWTASQVFSSSIGNWSCKCSFGSMGTYSPWHILKSCKKPSQKSEGWVYSCRTKGQLHINAHGLEWDTQEADRGVMVGLHTLLL